MRAWEIEKLSSQCQIPVQLEDNNEEIWLEQGTYSANLINGYVWAALMDKRDASKRAKAKA